MPSFGSPSGLTDSDPIEVDSPPTPKPKARIIVLDSSPLAPSTHQRQQGTTMSGAGSRFQQAMNGKGKGSLAPTGYRSSTPNSNGASMADLVNARSAGLMRGQTSAASSSAGSSSKHARTSPTLSDDDVRLLDQPRKKVKSDASREGSSRLSSIDLERFRFSDKSAQGQSSGRPSSDSDLSDEDAPGSDADVQLMEVEEERPKKRRLVRGGQPAPESPQKPISAAPKVESPKGKERAVTGNSLDAQESKADRILLIHPEWPRKEILAALQAHNWDSRAAIDALEKEKRERAQQRGAATVARLANGHGGCPSSARPQSANPSSVRPVAGSSAQAKARANAPTRKPARDVPSEDEGGGYSSSENENGYGQKEHKDEEAALKWFNTCDENAMMDTTSEYLSRIDAQKIDLG